MKVTRAVFLKTCSAVFLGARVDAIALLDTRVQPGTAAAPTSDEKFWLRSAGAERFRPHLNTSFTVRTADGDSVALLLAKVTEHPITKDVEQFSLIFHAPADTGIAHGTHRFQHRVLGEFDVFIVPIGAPNTVRTVYQACFSRHLSPAEVVRAPAAAAAPHRRT
jgi:hypothetical protein